MENTCSNQNVEFLNKDWMLPPSKGNEEIRENFKTVKHLIEQILMKVPESRVNNSTVTRKYFNYWKKHLDDKKEKMENQREAMSQKEKLNNFFNKIKRLKTKNNSTNEKTCENQTNDSNSKENCLNETDIVNAKPNEKSTKKIYGTIYKSRFQAQQDIIAVQKMKLDQQNKVIEDLKLGKITEELSKSLETSKTDIREIFAKSSTRTKCKIVPLLEDINNIRNFQLKSEKAPKIVQAMEQRAEKRALRRQIILERKRIIDEENKRMAELTLERKRIQDEEEKKRNLEELKERRRKEMQIQKIRQKNIEIHTNNVNRAIHLYHLKLKMFGFKAFRTIIRIKHENVAKSEKFLVDSLVKKCFHTWLKLHLGIEAKINEKADAHYRAKTLVKYVRLFKMVLVRKRQSTQVACDIYDLKLEIRFFSNWHLYVCKQYVRNHKNGQLANKHYQR